MQHIYDISFHFIRDETLLFARKYAKRINVSVTTRKIIITSNWIEIYQHRTHTHAGRPRLGTKEGPTQHNCVSVFVRSTCTVECILFWHAADIVRNVYWPWLWMHTAQHNDHRINIFYACNPKTSDGSGHVAHQDTLGDCTHTFSPKQQRISFLCAFRACILCAWCIVWL